MRSLILPFSVWIGVLQLPPANRQPVSLAATATLISIAVGLSGLSVAIYRLGFWRAEMANTKTQVAAELTRFREEVTQRFEQIDARLSSVEGWMRKLTHPMAE